MNFKRNNKQRTKKIMVVLAMILASSFLCSCSMVNKNAAEKIMEAKLNDRFGTGNYTISDVYKQTNGEYSLIYTYVSARVTLNTGEEFSCYVENRDGNFYQYYDTSGAVIFSESWIQREIERTIENVDGVKVTGVGMDNLPKIYDFYDATQATEYFDLIGSQGWHCYAEFEIDKSLSPQEAVEVAKQVMVSTDNCVVPNIDEAFYYGETLVVWGDERNYQNFQVGDDPITEEKVLRAFEIEVEQDSKIVEILDQRYGDRYSIKSRDGLIGQYRYFLEVDGKEIQGIYDGTTYQDNYEEVFQ